MKPTGGSKGNLSKLTDLQLDIPKEKEKTQINKPEIKEEILQPILQKYKDSKRLL